MYDKGVESKAMPPGYLWRMELEAKRTLAPALWTDLRNTTDVAEWCYNSLAEQWKRSGYSWPLTASTRGGEGIAVPSRAPTDSERLAQWLRVSVAPAVGRLLRKHSAAEVRRLLALETVHDLS